MKVTGEPFSFYHNRKGAEEVRYQKYPNFQAKGLLPDRTLESFITKAPKGQFLNFRKYLYLKTVFMSKESFTGLSGEENT